MLDANKLGALGVLIGDLTRDAVGDLSPTAAAILLTLHHHGDATATTLAAIVGISQPTAVRVCRGLVERGLVGHGQRAGKTVPLHLTEAGDQRAVELQSARLDALDRLLAPLAASDRELLSRLLDDLLAGATTSRTFARTTCRLCDHALCDGPACPVGTRATEIERAQRNQEE